MRDRFTSRRERCLAHCRRRLRTVEPPNLSWWGVWSLLGSDDDGEPDADADDACEPHVPEDQAGCGQALSVLTGPADLVACHVSERDGREPTHDPEDQGEDREDVRVPRSIWAGWGDLGRGIGPVRARAADNRTDAPHNAAGDDADDEKVDELAGE